MKIDLRVNGVEHVSEVEPRTLLVHYLRETLNLTGTHIGCETTLCGACTVLMDGAAVKSCTVLAVQADGTEITTQFRKVSGKNTACSAASVLRE